MERIGHDLFVSITFRLLLGDKGVICANVLILLTVFPHLFQQRSNVAENGSGLCATLQKFATGCNNCATNLLCPGRNHASLPM
jgi:hypothetical protein